MSRTYKDSNKARPGKRQRNISVRGVRKDPPDLRKLSRALIQLAMAEAEAEAEATVEDRRATQRPDDESAARSADD